MDNNMLLAVLSIIGVITIIAVFGMSTMTGYGVKKTKMERELQPIHKLTGSCAMYHQKCLMDQIIIEQITPSEYITNCLEKCKLANTHGDCEQCCGLGLACGIQEGRIQPDTHKQTGVQEYCCEDYEKCPKDPSEEKGCLLIGSDEAREKCSAVEDLLVCKDTGATGGGKCKAPYETGPVTAEDGSKVCVDCDGNADPDILCSKKECTYSYPYGIGSCSTSDGEAHCFAEDPCATATK